MSIQKVWEAKPKECSKEYEQGWLDCIHHMFTKYRITNRGDDSPVIGLKIEITEDNKND